MGHFCIITTSSYLICLKIFLKTDFWTPLSYKDLSKNKPLLVTIIYEDIFVLCLHAIGMYAAIKHNAFSK